MVKRPISSSNPLPSTNHLLAALPPEDYARVVRSLDAVFLKLKQSLHKAGELVQHVYFPGGGFVSLVTVLGNGSMVEISTIGREGLTGLPAAMNGQPSFCETFVQGEGPICWRMSVTAFHRELEHRGAFYDLMTRYNNALASLIMQSTACNATHSVEQRLSRWLLMAHDRMEVNDFPLTQEFVAMMLGASRPMVTVVAGSLQNAGLITYHRGHLTIVDRDKLEAASCECYRVSADILKGVTAKGRRN